MLAATAEYRADSDDVGRFLDDADWISKAPTLQATTAVLHAGYLLWVKQEGGEEIGLKAFGKVLDDKGFPVNRPHQDGPIPHRDCVRAR